MAVCPAVYALPHRPLQLLRPCTCHPLSLQIAKIEGAKDFRQLRTRKMGHYVMVDLEVKVEPTLSVSAALHVR